ncbi:hypothetical protein, partial [Methylobacterium hispanicum]|uniref:hypothetical protein n=1 Tax=Methylobacterium hispanicum TaxID=270350 RepID=UPI001EDDFD3A
HQSQIIDRSTSDRRFQQSGAPKEALEPASHLTSQIRTGTRPTQTRDRKDDAAHASLSQINLSKSARTHPEAAPGSGANPGET